MTLLAQTVPRSVLEFAYARRDKPPFSWIKSALERGLGDAKHGVRIVRGELAGFTMAFDPSGSKARWMGLHEPKVQEAVISNLKPGMVAWDVGAHIGYYVLLMAKLVGDAGRVVGFEPFTENFELLKRNIDNNSLSDRVEARLMALGEHSGTGEIALGYQSGNAKVIAGGPGSILISTLDEEVEREDRRPDLIVFDTEGAEEAILRGGAKFLAAADATLILEHHGRRDALIDLLSGYGMTCRDLDPSHFLAKRGLEPQAPG